MFYSELIEYFCKYNQFYQIITVIMESVIEKSNKYVYIYL